MFFSPYPSAGCCTRYASVSSVSTRAHPRSYSPLLAVLAIVITTSILRCFLARARPGKTSGPAGAIAEAAERQRQQRQLGSFLNQAQLDVEDWMREMEREIRQREGEEESVPPPYSSHPKLPSWSEHERLRAQEEGQGQEASGRQDLGESIEDRLASDLALQPVSTKEIQTPPNARIRYPPPSYLP